MLEIRAERIERVAPTMQPCDCFGRKSVRQRNPIATGKKYAEGLGCSHRRFVSTLSGMDSLGQKSTRTTVISSFFAQSMAPSFGIAHATIFSVHYRGDQCFKTHASMVYLCSARAISKSWFCICRSLEFARVQQFGGEFYV